MRLLDVDAFATSGNGSLASLDRPAVLADKLDWLRHAMEAYTGAPFLPQAALGAEDAARQSMFEQIYKSGIWQHGNASLPLSGTGSTAEASANARVALAAALGRTRARSVLDAPCGDFTWMRLMLPTFARLDVNYTGVDIARPQIARLQAEFEGTAGVEFRVGDLVVEPPPRAGLIFSREMTQHLNPEEVLRVLHHWSRSGSRYLLQTTYRLKDGSNRNFDRVSRGSHSMIDFERVPYSLPPPIASWVEGDTHTHTERLALWRLPLQTHVYGVAAEAGTAAPAAAPAPAAAHEKQGWGWLAHLCTRHNIPNLRLRLCEQREKGGTDVKAT